MKRNLPLGDGDGLLRLQTSSTAWFRCVSSPSWVSASQPFAAGSPAVDFSAYIEAYSLSVIGH
jgi:hypothetical protein